jgi:hypothetical protein
MMATPISSNPLGQNLSRREPDAREALLVLLVALEAFTLVRFAGPYVIGFGRGSVGRWLVSEKGIETIPKFTIGEIPFLESTSVPTVTQGLPTLLSTVSGLITVLWWSGLGETVMTFLETPLTMETIRHSVAPPSPGKFPSDPSSPVIEVLSKTGRDRVLVGNLTLLDP